MRIGSIAMVSAAAVAAVAVPVLHFTGAAASTTPGATAAASTTPGATAVGGGTGDIAVLNKGGSSAKASRLMRLDRVGFFRSSCGYSHTANDDPILMPGMPGMAMEHDFFSNTTTNADSTASSLLAAGTSSCLSQEDTAAYWAPTLFQNGQQVTPKRMLAYYQIGVGTEASQIQAMPFGLELIAGNEKGTTPPPLNVISWNCGTRAGKPIVPATDVPPTACPSGSTIHLAIHFPNCWDGVNLNGATQTNAAYSVRGMGCPAGYPVAIPALTMHINYPISSGAGIQLSSAPGTTASVDTAHGDFINAWNESFLTSMVDECIHGNLRCGTIGSANQPLFNVLNKQVKRPAKTARVAKIV